MNKTALAKRINVTRQTISNWEKTKPELIRLLNIGLKSDDHYIKFLQLFPGNGKILETMHDFYIDFYFNFLSYYRQNITNPKQGINYAQTDLFSSVLIYFMETDKKSLFDSALKASDEDISKFVRRDFKKPINISDEHLSKYILRNTLDDFETLIKDIILHEGDDNMFANAVKIGITYLVHKLEPGKSYNKKSHTIYSKLKTIGIDSLDPIHTIQDRTLIFERFLAFRDEYTKKHIDVLAPELELYKNNHFYTPDFIKTI